MKLRKRTGPKRKARDFRQPVVTRLSHARMLCEAQRIDVTGWTNAQVREAGEAIELVELLEAEKLAQERAEEGEDG